MKFLAFAASHRPGSYNRKLMKYAAAHLESQGMDVDFTEYAEFDMPLFNDFIVETSGIPAPALSFARRAEHADGIIISVPEYNWSYPGSLKNIIDWTSCINPYPLAGKTVLLLGASPGMRGGILGLHHLKSPLEAIELVVFNKVFPLGNCVEAFDEFGKLADPKHSQNLISILNHYAVFTKNLSKH